MKTWDVSGKDSQWEVLHQTPRTQGAMMCILGGESEGSPDNMHQDSDQWLYVLSGTGEAIVAGKSVPLRTGMLVLIEAGDTHEIKADLGTVLRTVNFYGPPAEFED